MISNFLPFTHDNFYFVVNMSPDLFINVSLALLIIFYSYFAKIINKVECTLFLFSILVVVFLIPYLFPTKYLADQIPYTNFIREIRMGILPETGFITLVASYIYSLFPLPTPSSVVSFSLYNKILLLLILIYLKYNSYINSNGLIILLLFPSLTLYSSLALREMLVLMLMIIWLIFILNKKYIFAIICVGLFYFVKKQNMVIFGFFTVFHFYYYFFLLNFQNRKMNFFLSSTFLILILPRLFAFKIDSIKD